MDHFNRYNSELNIVAWATLLLVAVIAIPR